MSGFLGRLRWWLYGPQTAAVPKRRRDARQLIRQLVRGEVRRLPDEDLIALVEELLSEPRYREALRGNTRFLQSVSTQFLRRRTITLKQRYAIYNILERAFPHNLASELLRP